MAVQTTKGASALVENRPIWRRAVVTGGAGFLGSHLCHSLLTAGTEVVCVDNFLTSSPDRLQALRAEPGFTVRRADVTAGLDIDGHVDLVVHLASPASPIDYHRDPERAGTGGQDRGPVRPDFHLGGVRRPGGQPAERGLLRQREPGGPAQR